MPAAITPQRIAQLLTEAPGWARVGLTALTERLRDSAAETLGLWACEGLEVANDTVQFVLPLTS